MQIPQQGNLWLLTTTGCGNDDIKVLNEVNKRDERLYNDGLGGRWDVHTPTDVGQTCG